MPAGFGMMANEKAEEKNESEKGKGICIPAFWVPVYSVQGFGLAGLIGRSQIRTILDVRIFVLVLVKVLIVVYSNTALF